MPLRLDLVRHGEAEAPRSDDAARPLSARGRQDVGRLADAYLARGWVFERVYTSPLRRAQETASLLIERVSPHAACVVLAALTPESDPEEVIEALVEQGAQGHAVLVGHQPLLGRLASFLTAGPVIPMPTSGLVVLRCEGALRRGSAAVETALDPSRWT